MLYTCRIRIVFIGKADILGFAIGCGHAYEPMQRVQLLIMKRLVRQMLRFAAVGLSAFAIDYVLFLLLHLLGVPYLIANIASYTISTIYNFVLSMRFVFSGKASQTRGQQLGIFLALSAVGLVLNELYLYLLVSCLNIAPALSKVVATFLVTIFNFVTRKFFLEDHGAPALQEQDNGDLGEALEEGSRDVSAILREQIELWRGKRKFKIL